MTHPKKCCVCVRVCVCVCVLSPYRLLQGVAAAEVFELRVRAGSLASVSVSRLARKVLLDAAIWQRHVNTDTHVNRRSDKHTQIIKYIHIQKH